MYQWRSDYRAPEDPLKKVEFYPKGSGEPLQDLEQEWMGCQSPEETAPL